MIRILYVEDEPFLAKIVRETLESNDYIVRWVANGKKAIDIFQIGNFDICILDIMLPRLNGYEIAREIRKVDKSLPIIFLTAKDQTSDLLKGFDVGGNDYLRKPFSMEELMVRIQNLLKLTGSNKLNKNQSVTSDLGFGFFFNKKKLELKTPVEVISLSHRESQVLEYLCTHNDDLVNRKQLLLHVWGDDSFYNSRNLDVYITKLRGYLKTHPKLKIITLKGVGYQFITGA